ncbi:aminotransferase [Flexivirga caeni]|uniref:Aminotransferase n=1 Tax=Flexivirga caeni TaxID=2294115 RepID=A0A3M9M7Q3_9MICO|nr:aminotransferase [Flexivirga caeni]RNI21589.1 aminotransferase [Flexivirga caeni]
MSPTRPLHELSADEIAAFRQEQQAAYDRLLASGLKLDLTRGKPSAEQLDLSNALLELPTTYRDAAGTDTRNYGGLLGLTGLREIFAEVLRVETSQLIAGGNSSLTMMKDVLTYLLLFGGVDSARPWIQDEQRRFICPVPGYDRHFLLTETLGFEPVTVPMREDGPDADAIAALVADDPTIKGMWLVPTYANPSGDVCSQEVAAKLASMSTAAPDFKILWDNAYAVHHLTAQETKSADILSLAAASGHPHRPVLFASTSKITFAGAGVAFLAASQEQVAWFVKYLGIGSIGPDKVNQLRHLEFFGDAEGVLAHMAKHRAILAPKFAEVQRILNERLGGLGVAKWTDPVGGYFVSVDVLPGTASRVVELAKEAGIALTPAGAAYPQGNDPDDTNLRLAPSFPVLEEVTAAMDAVATCMLLAAAEKLSA